MKPPFPILFPSSSSKPMPFCVHSLALPGTQDSYEDINCSFILLQTKKKKIPLKHLSPNQESIREGKKPTIVCYHMLNKK